MTDQERYSPLPVRRQLRQECGFGCCVCGNPVFEYHHIIDYAVARAHDPAHMMTLCPNHHHEATVGSLTEDEQRRHKADPKNIANGFADGLLKVTDPGVAVRVGGVDLVGEGFKLVVDGEPLLVLDSDDQGRLLLSLDLYDTNNQLLLSISKNEWISGDPLPWDIEFGHRWLTLRRKHRDVTLAIDATKIPTGVSGTLTRSGQTFGLGAEELTFNGIVTGVGFRELGLVGMYLAANTVAGTLSLSPEPSLGHGMIVSWPDRAERVVKCFEALGKLKSASV